MNNLSIETHYDKYTQHLKSVKWKILKKEYWWSDRPNSCWACDKEAPKNYQGFNFHHKTYKNLFNETLNDVVLLCREHHADLEEWLIVLKPSKETVESWTPKYIKLVRNFYNLSNAKIQRWI